MSDDATIPASVWRLLEGRLTPEEATIIVEEPLEIVVDGISYVTIMRTPGDDIALAAGFCLAEGLIERAQDLGSIQACDLEDAHQVAVTRIGDRSAPEPRMMLPATSSCGLCGRDMIDDLVANLPEIESDLRVSAADLLVLGRRLQESQQLFRPTGGAHAAALFDAKLALISSAEDIGRHNALDKAIGRLLLARRLGEARVALLSGRCSFEMMQKAARAAIPIVASVSAPTALALDLARRTNITLVGFVRREALTVYLDAGRISDLR
jgi:FdhD protein